MDPIIFRRLITSLMEEETKEKQKSYTEKHKEIVDQRDNIEQKIMEQKDLLLKKINNNIMGLSEDEVYHPTPLGVLRFLLFSMGFQYQLIASTISTKCFGLSLFKLNEELKYRCARVMDNLKYVYGDSEFSFLNSLLCHTTKNNDFDLKFKDFVPFYVDDLLSLFNLSVVVQHKNCKIINIKNMTIQHTHAYTSVLCMLADVFDRKFMDSVMS